MIRHSFLKFYNTRFGFWWFLVPIALSIYIIALFYFSANHPFSDDFFLFLRPANDLKQNRISDLLYSLWYSNNEHRLAFLSGISLINLLLFSNINFMILANLGNIALPIIIVLLCLNFELKYRVWIAPFFIFFIITLQHYETISWVTSIYQNYWVILWFLSTVWLLNKPNINVILFLLSFIFALFCSFSSGCGLLVWPIGAWLLFKLNRKVIGYIWSLSGSVLIILYLYKLPPSYEMLHFKSAFLQAPWRLPLFGLYFLGALFRFSSLGNWWPGLCGFLLLVAITYLYLSGFFKQRLLLSALIIYCLLTTLLVMLNRFVVSDHIAFLSRYKITPNILWAIILVSLIIQIFNVYGDIIGRQSTHLLCLFGFIFCLASGWVNWNNLKIFADDKKDWLARLNIKECPQMRDQVRLSVKIGVFVPPQDFRFELYHKNRKLNK